MARGAANVERSSAGSQATRPGRNNKAGPRVVKSAGSQRPKQGAKPAATKARAVIVSTKPKPNNNNRPIVKPTNKPIRQNVTKVVTKAPRQKIILQESQKKAAPKPAAITNKQQNGNRNASAANMSRNASRPNSAASVPAARLRENNNASRNNSSGGPANQSELARALQTANSIAITRSHPKQAEVVELLRTHEKGWVDDRKFITLLKSLAF